MRVEDRAARKGDSPLGGEGGFTGDVRISQFAAGQVLAGTVACSKTPSWEQRFALLLLEVKVGGGGWWQKLGLGRVVVSGSGKALRGLWLLNYIL